ncbi:APC family permease [Micrococcus luteus]|uniref:APC family permease n=1 Tax=Micrococcus TaxID=1269 RepID=UPI002A37FC2A|nr:APC family permease [Micrococcus luteus]
MATLSSLLRRGLLGRPVTSHAADEPRMNRWRALPVTSSNALSSLAYAPDEVILTLVAAGTSALALGPAVGWAVVAVMLLIVVSFRAAVAAVPHGGIYHMAGMKLGPRAGVVASAALLLDFVFTAAVSVAAFAHFVAALAPGLTVGSRVLVASAALVGVLLAALRGVRLSRWVLPVLVSVFVALTALLVLAGLWQEGRGLLGAAPTAGWTQEGVGVGGTVGTVATALLALRAFSAGSVLLTGVEVPVSSTRLMARPAVPTVRWVLTVMALTLGALTVGVMHLAQRTGVVVGLELENLRDAAGAEVTPDRAPAPVLAQLADTVYGPGSILSVATIAATALLLLFAAKSAFRSFPALAARVAEDGYLPRQLRVRSDRLVHTWSVLGMGAVALSLVVLFEARTALLVQLYVIGVLLAFTLAQAGMLRLWRRRLVHTPGSRARAAVRLRLIITAVAWVVTALAGVVVLVTRFTQGAWVALLAIVLGSLVMGRIRRHYADVDRELAPDPQDDARALPSRVHVVVVVTTLDRPALRALAYARASRPSSLEAVVVDAERAATLEVIDAWERAGLPMSLTVIASPYRDTVAPLVRHVREHRRRSPRDLTMVFIPEYVVRPGWRTLLHNRTATRQTRRLQREPGVMVGSVPWQVHEGQGS